MTIFPLGGGLLFENNIGATDKRAALYRACSIAAFPGVVGNWSFLFQARK